MKKESFDRTPKTTAMQAWVVYSEKEDLEPQQHKVIHFDRKEFAKNPEVCYATYILEFIKYIKYIFL